MAYLSLWLAGKLRCFDGHGHPWKAVVSVIPTGLAVWIGITRLQVGSAACAESAALLQISFHDKQICSDGKSMMAKTCLTGSARNSQLL